MSISDVLQDRDYTTLLNEALDLVPDTIDKREGSVAMTSIAPMMYKLAEAYSDLRYLLRQCYGSTANGDFLTMIGEGLGVERKDGVTPDMYFIFTKNNAVVPSSDYTAWIGYTFKYDMSDGTEWRFKIIDQYTVVIDGVSTPIYRCVSQNVVGDYTRLITLIKSTNVVCEFSALNGAIATPYNDSTYKSNYGQDGETDDVYRERYLTELRAIRFGGNYSDYMNLTTIAPSLMAVTNNGSTKYTKMEVIRGTNGLVHMLLARKDNVTGEWSLFNGTEKSEVKEELDPTSYSGQGNGFLPIGHQLKMGNNNTVKLTFSIGVTGNTVATSVIASEVIEALNEYFTERNDAEFEHRNTDGTYPTLRIGFSDVLTAWGKAYRTGYGTLSSMSVTKYTVTDEAGTATQNSVNWTSATQGADLNRAKSGSGDSEIGTSYIYGKQSVSDVTVTSA